MAFFLNGSLIISEKCVVEQHQDIPVLISTSYKKYEYLEMRRPYAK